MHWRHSIKVNSMKCFVNKAMMGLCIMAFCRSSILSYINNIDKDEVKTGFGGNMGNKGSVAIRFDMHLTPIII